MKKSDPTLLRFFLDQDGDCHWYLVPESKREKWEKWKDSESWKCLDFAKPLGGGPRGVTFERPLL